MPTCKLLSPFLAALVVVVGLARPASGAAAIAPAAAPTSLPQSSESPQGESRPNARVPQSLQSREATREALEATARQITTKQEQRAEAEAAGETERVKALDEEIRQERTKFNDLASGMQLSQLEGGEVVGEFDLQQQVVDLIRPLVNKLKELTAEPRQLDDLESRRDEAEERLRLIRIGRETVRRTMEALPEGSPVRTRAEFELREYWNRRVGELESEYLVLKANVQGMQDSQKGLWERFSGSLDGFVRSSGLNLVLCVVAFLAVFTIMRLIGRVVLRKKADRAFSRRLLEVIVHTLTIVLAVLATILVPYVRGDLLLLSIGIVFLLGAGWVIVKTAPDYFEQVRLMLNVGSVREGERMMIDGLPYRVDALRVYSRLVNPELTGGHLRVPIRDLVGQQSRPTPPDEPWFPCSQGDVVALDDGVVGRVTMQTPQVVVVVERRDAPKTYTTASFLDENPRNLSNGFELRVVFGVDYRHQEHALDAVPKALHAAVKHALEAEPDVPRPHHVRVELTSAGTSSLDFIVVAEYDGEAATQYFRLRRRVNQALVRACNEHGLTIPFPQLQVHGVSQTG